MPSGPKRSLGAAIRGAPRPAKTCAQCGRPFEWRKKWARDWEQVKFCSDACRRGKVPRRVIVSP